MTRIAVVSTIMRVVMGILFLAHGISKLQMGLGNVEAWFGSLGLPGLLAYGVAILELVGGVMLIIGLFTRYISALFTIMLIGAIVTTKLSAGLLGHDQMVGYEMELSFMLVTLYLTVAASTPLSMDQVLLRKRSV